MNRNSGDYEDVFLHDTLRRTQYYLLYLKGLKAEDCSDSTPWRQLRVSAPGDSGPFATTGWTKEEADLSRPPMPSGASGTLALWDENLELLLPENMLDREFKVEVYSKGALGRATVLAEGVFCPRNELLLPNALPIYIQVELFSQNVSTKRITPRGTVQLTSVLEKSLEKLESIVPTTATAATAQKKPNQEDNAGKKGAPAMIMATPPPPPPPFQDLSEDSTYAGAGSDWSTSFRDSSSSSTVSAKTKNRLSVRQRLSAGVKSVQKLMSLSPTRLFRSGSQADIKPPPPPPPLPPIYSSPDGRPGSRRESGEYVEEHFMTSDPSFRVPPPPNPYTPIIGTSVSSPPPALSRAGSARGAPVEVSKETLAQDNDVLRQELKRANKELDEAVIECFELSSKWERLREAMASYKEEMDDDKSQIQIQLDALKAELERAKVHVGEKRSQSDRLGRELCDDDSVVQRLKQQLQETRSAQCEEVEQVRQQMEAQKREFDKEKLDLCSKILLRSSTPARRQSIFGHSSHEHAPSSSNSSSSGSVSPNRRRSVAVAHDEVNKDELELWMKKYVEISQRLDVAKRELVVARQAPATRAGSTASPDDPEHLWRESVGAAAGAALTAAVEVGAPEEVFPEYSETLLAADDDIVYESISVQAQLAAALEDNEALVTTILVHMSSISKEAGALAERNLADGVRSEFTRLINFSKAIKKLLSDSQLLSELCPAFALSPQLREADGSDCGISQATRLSRLQHLLQRSLRLVARIEESIGVSSSLGDGASPQSQGGSDSTGSCSRKSLLRRNSSVRSSIRLSRRYSSPFRDDDSTTLEAREAVAGEGVETRDVEPPMRSPGHHQHQQHNDHHRAKLNEKLKLIYDDVQPMADTLKELLQESPYLSPEAQQRAKHYGTKFITSTYFFNAANSADGHSIGSLLIKSSCLPVVQAIFKNWPDLELSVEGAFNYGVTTLKSDSPGDQKVSAAKVDIDSKAVDFSNPKALRALGFSLAQIKQSGRFEEQDFLSFGLSAKELKAVGFDVIKLRKAGYSVIDCFKAGFNAQQLRKGGFDESLVVKSGRFTPELLHHSGFDVQRHALVSLFEALDGNHWRNKHNWCSARSLSEWHGVHLNGAGLVSKLDLRSNLLRGELPTSIALLSSLEYLDLGNNDLSGELHTAPLSRLTRLRDLWLTINPRLLVRPAAKPALRAALPKCVFRVDVNADLPNMLQE